MRTLASWLDLVEDWSAPDSSGVGLLSVWPQAIPTIHVGEAERDGYSGNVGGLRHVVPGGLFGEVLFQPGTPHYVEGFDLFDAGPAKFFMRIGESVLLTPEIATVFARPLEALFLTTTPLAPVGALISPGVSYRFNAPGLRVAGGAIGEGQALRLQCDTLGQDYSISLYVRPC